MEDNQQRFLNQMKTRYAKEIYELIESALKKGIEPNYIEKHLLAHGYSAAQMRLVIDVLYKGNEGRRILNACIKSGEDVKKIPVILEFWEKGVPLDDLIKGSNQAFNLNDLRSSYETRLEEVAKMEKQIQEANDKEQREFIEEKLAQLNKEVKAFKDGYESYVYWFQKVDSLLDNFEAKENAASQTDSETIQRLGELEAEVKRLNADNEQLHTEKENLINEKDLLCQEREKLATEKENLSVEIDALKVSIAEANTTMTNQQTNLNNVCGALSKQSSDIEELKNSNAKLLADKEELEAENKRLATSEEKLAGEIAKLKAKEKPNRPPMLETTSDEYYYDDTPSVLSNQKSKPTFSPYGADVFEAMQAAQEAELKAKRDSGKVEPIKAHYGFYLKGARGQDTIVPIDVQKPKGMFVNLIKTVVEKRGSRRDVMRLASKGKFSPEQLEQLSMALEAGLNDEQMRLLSDPKLTVGQMQGMIRIGLCQNRMRNGGD